MSRVSLVIGQSLNGYYAALTNERSPTMRNASREIEQIKVKDY